MLVKKVKINDKELNFISWSEKSLTSNGCIIDYIHDFSWENNGNNITFYINNQKIKGLNVLQVKCHSCDEGIYNINTSRLKQFINGKNNPHFICRSCSIKNNKKKQDWEKYKKTRKENWNKKTEEEKKEFSKKISNTKLSSYKEEDLNIEKFILEYKMGKPLYKIKHLVGGSNALAKKILGENNIDVRNQSEAQRLSTKENPFSKNEIKERLKKTRRKKFVENLLSSKRLDDKVTPLFSASEYTTVAEKYKWECKECKTIFQDHLDDGRIPRCPTCYPHEYNISSTEKEVFEFIQSLNIENISRNDKSILEGKELDIYLPDYKLAIEFDGIYWHSELSGKDRNYHLNKTLACESKDIQLIHIFEDEWIERQEIVESIIKSRLGLGDKIYGRKCTVVYLGNEEVKSFYNNNHLQGYISSKINIGLFYENELISCMSFGKSRFNKSYDWEITRFANKLGISVIGGFAKLLKHFKNNYSGSIVTYADRRYFDGKIYKENNFKKIKSSSPSYYYTDHRKRFNRQQFQKHKLKDKLEIFDPNLTEWENMQLNGWDRIWDCGNNVFVLNK